MQENVYKAHPTISSNIAHTGRTRLIRTQLIRSTYSPIHKAAGSLVTGCSLQNGKMSMGNHHTE